jgi:hypothetical protein
MSLDKAMNMTALTSAQNKEQCHPHEGMGLEQELKMMVSNVRYL